ncbi:MAG TPA: biopolymer transporter ExbD [Xanthomonadaceae bacterium]|nr:biopolymer transporter ExbD [Xanthomonadaceae bacterium]
MAIKPHQPQEEVVAEINMTPLIDIMMVLLIIFMVTSSIGLESGVDVSLPAASSNKQFQKDDQGVIVSLNSKGEVYIQGKSVGDNLAEVLEKELDDSPSKLIIFEGDREATLGKAISIMDVAKKVGALKFAIATEQKN